VTWFRVWVWGEYSPAEQGIVTWFRVWVWGEYSPAEQGIVTAPWTPPRADEEKNVCRLQAPGGGCTSVNGRTCVLGVQGLGFRVKDLRIWGLRSRAKGLSIWGLGFRV
jgi:hypothetical protein